MLTQRPAPSVDLAEILVVDDSDEFTRYFARIIALDYPDIAVAVWDWRQDIPPADHDWSHTRLIVLDYRLGDRDGLDWLEKLRSRPSTPPIVLVTSAFDDRVRDRALALGAARFFRKDELTRRVISGLVKSVALH